MCTTNTLSAAPSVAKREWSNFYISPLSLPAPLDTSTQGHLSSDSLTTVQGEQCKDEL